LTLSAVLSGVALRVMRAAAGRRALQLALLVGGLFALGLLCGEQAHAADGVLSATPTSSVTAKTSGTPTVSTGPVRSLAKGSVGQVVSSRPADDRVVRPVVRHVVRSVDARVAQPVGRLVGTVTTGLAEAEAEVETKVPGLSELPDLSDLPGLSELPGAPGLPALPALPGQTLPAPVTSAPETGSSATPPATKEQRPEGRSAAAMPLTYGPRFAAGAVTADDGARTSAHKAAPAGQAPARHAPPGDPGGVFSGKSAVDNGSPRHGDVHAVTDSTRAPLPLMAGVAARTAADGTRDRYRDIPVFPG
jgi:hypothetical protein